MASRLSKQVQRRGATELGGLPPATEADGCAVPAIKGGRRMNTWTNSGQ